MELPSLLSVSPIYLAILGLLFVPMTLRVGLYRVKNNVSLGTGDDPELVRRIRGQGNFVETVPIAIVLLVVMEVLGAGDMWLHVLGAALVLGRVLHYVGLTEIGPAVCRPIGMITTLIMVAVSAIWVLVDAV